MISSWRLLRKDEEGLGRKRTEEGVEGKLWRRVGEGLFIKLKKGKHKGTGKP